METIQTTFPAATDYCVTKCDAVLKFKADAVQAYKSDERSRAFAELFTEYAPKTFLGYLALATVLSGSLSALFFAGALLAGIVMLTICVGGTILWATFGLIALALVISGACLAAAAGASFGGTLALYSVYAGWSTALKLTDKSVSFLYQRVHRDPEPKTMSAEEKHVNRAEALKAQAAKAAAEKMS